MIQIDENSNEHMAHWLIKNGYSKDETVYIFPTDKDYNGPIYERGYWYDIFKRKISITRNSCVLYLWWKWYN